jgi:hypothetical protein
MGIPIGNQEMSVRRLALLTMIATVAVGLAADLSPSYRFEDLAWDMPIEAAQTRLEQGGFVPSGPASRKLERRIVDRLYEVELIADAAGQLSEIRIEVGFDAANDAGRAEQRSEIVDGYRSRFGRPTDTDDSRNAAGEVLWSAAADGSSFEATWDERTDLRLRFRRKSPGVE